MTTQPSHHQAGAQQTALEDVVLECSVLLTTLDGRAPLVAALIDTRQAGSPYVSHSTRVKAGAAYLEAKRDSRLAQAHGFTGLARTPMPGGGSGWATAVEIDVILRDQLRRVIKAHGRAGVCVLPHLTAPVHRDAEGAGDRLAGTRALLRAVRELSWTLTSIGTATALRRELQHAADLSKHLLDGETRLDLAAECPYCGRRSLIVYLETGVIRCEPGRDPNTHEVLHCRCNRPTCTCRDHFVHHTWLRDTRHRDDSWQALADRLNVTATARKDHR